MKGPALMDSEEIGCCRAILDREIEGTRAHQATCLANDEATQRKCHEAMQGAVGCQRLVPLLGGQQRAGADVV